MQSVNKRKEYVNNTLNRPFWLDTQDDLGGLDKANISSFRNFLRDEIQVEQVTGF